MMNADLAVDALREELEIVEAERDALRAKLATVEAERDAAKMTSPDGVARERDESIGLIRCALQLDLVIGVACDSIDCHHTRCAMRRLVARHDARGGK